MPATPTEQNPPVTPEVAPVLYPLDDFYARAGRPLPQIDAIAGDAMPEPYRSLLVHPNDMTSTLKGHYASGLHVEVLHRHLRDDFYFREVVLVLDPSQARVEFGAIKINLSMLPPPARREILEERNPLGQILHAHQICYESSPKAYLRLVSDAFIEGALSLPGRSVLYGRRNTLADPSGRSIAEIVEILPPAPVGEECDQDPITAGLKIFLERDYGADTTPTRKNRTISAGFSGTMKLA